MNLSEYVKRRNGVDFGQSNSLRNNLKRSFGAKNFAVFWNFWNPIFGYYLGTKVFKPLKSIFPSWISLLLTFVFCGFVHDLVTTAVRGRISLFFSIWFLLMGICVLFSKHYDLSAKKWIIRAAVNLSIIAVSFLLTHALNSIFSFY